MVCRRGCGDLEDGVPVSLLREYSWGSKGQGRQSIYHRRKAEKAGDEEISLEEEKLIERFGDEYRAYAKRTGRLLPRIKRDQAGIRDSVPSDIT